MSKGVLLFCFDTLETKYHKILERCVSLVKKNLGVPVTVVTDHKTYKKMAPMGFVNYKLIEPERGNKFLGKDWHNCDRHMAYELSPYETTMVLDIDYFCYTDDLAQYFDTKYDFLVSDKAYDLSNGKIFDFGKYSIVTMVWATVLVFRKTAKAKRIFDTVKYVKSYYPYFLDLYRINSRNFRNDYAFGIALQQINGFIGYEKLPFALPTLPRHCEIQQINDSGLVWKHNDRVGSVVDQDVHVLNKELANV